MFVAVQMADVSVEGRLVDSVPLGSADSDGFTDISGCRASGWSNNLLFKLCEALLDWYLKEKMFFKFWDW